MFYIHIYSLPLWWTPQTDQDPGNCLFSSIYLYVTFCLQTGQGQGTANIIQHMAGLSQYTGPGGQNDPDFLETGLLLHLFVVFVFCSCVSF
jgi:hypothetical protein